MKFIIFTILTTAYVSAKEIPYGTITPTYQIAKKNHKATITCHSFKSPTWTKNSVLVQDHRQGSQSYVIDKATEKDNGLYICNGYLSSGVPFVTQAEFYVGSKL